MFFTVLLKNPKAIEWGVSLSAMFIHFYKHSNFVVDLTNQQIEYIDEYGEDNYNQKQNAYDRNKSCELRRVKFSEIYIPEQLVFNNNSIR